MATEGHDAALSQRCALETTMAQKPDRDIEKDYLLPDFIDKLRRLANALENGQRFEIQIAAERVDLTGWFWAGLIERISSNQRSPECPEVESSAPSRLW